MAETRAPARTGRQDGDGRGRTGLRLAAGAVLLFAASGLLLWSRQGDAVFSEYLASALAWCF